MKYVVSILSVLVAAILAFALRSYIRSHAAVAEPRIIEVQKLPAPALGPTPLGEALQKRSSNRVFSGRSIDAQTLSNLLWAADGVNRPANGGRTAPSAYDWRYIEIYLADARGFGRYDAVHHSIERIGTNDIRALTGVQDFVKSAPLTLILVSNERKMDKHEIGKKETDEMVSIFSGVSAGAIAQNVYLECAASGLNVVVRASLDRKPLHKALGLGPDQKIIVGQTIGFPPPDSAR